MSALGKITLGSHIAYYSLMFFIAYTFKGQVSVFAGQVKIVSHLSCRTSAILKYLSALGRITLGSHITYYSLMFSIAYTFKGQVPVFAGQVKIVSHLSCRTSAILKYLCPLGALYDCFIDGKKFGICVPEKRTFIAQDIILLNMAIPFIRGYLYSKFSFGEVYHRIYGHNFFFTVTHQGSPNLYPMIYLHE